GATIGLDTTQIRETRQLIKDLGRRQTILLSSHILHEVEQICTRTIIINGGRIVASGTPDELRQRVSAESRLIAEIKGPPEAVKKDVAALAGVKGVELRTDGGWHRLVIERTDGADVREAVFKLAGERGWSLREMRHEVASLEDFFVKIIAQQQDGDR
ncbi:MAG: ABC transporter ATP-binding protein, partial [Planctomycetes bacterium]|nr:ABC transporter ATP-binding protein [Planctomycetota bacterium]